MKKIILLILLISGGILFAQSKTSDTLFVPSVNADTSVVRLMGFGGPVSFDIDWSELDGIDTLFVYGTNRPDSTGLSPLWVDVNPQDGVNDNPWTLIDSTSIPPLWSLAWPWDYVKFTLKKGTSTAGLIIEKSALQSSVVHMTLNKLVAKGFVSFIKEGQRNHYQATDPKHISEYIDDKKTQFEKILPDIGVLVSFDPVAADAASLDLVEKNAGKQFSKMAYDVPYREQINYARELGFGNPDYELTIF